MKSKEMIKKLIDMGFQKDKVEKSVRVTKSRSIDLALEWLLTQNDEVESSVSQEDSASSNTFKTDESTEEKQLLTEEENKKMKDCLEEKHKESKVKAKRGKLETKKNRIKSEDKLSPAKFTAKRKQEDGNLDGRKREKQEEIIDLDQVTGVEQPKEVFTATVNPQKLSDSYTETKLQIRFTNGESIIQTFNVKEMLAAVKVYVELNRSDGDAPFCLMTSFPKKIFSKDDYEKSLDQLGLFPRAVIIVSKPSE